MHRRALQELVSDAVGVHLFGPNAVFSSFDVFGQAELDSPPTRPEYYPPSRYRLRLMRDLLAKGGHANALRTLTIPDNLNSIRDATTDVLDHLDGLVAQTSDKAALLAEPLTRLAYEWLEQTLPNAILYAQGRVSAVTYPSEAIGKEVIGLIERLSLKVPPNEIATWPNQIAVDWRSGLLASWLTAFSTIVDAKLDIKDCLKSVHTTQKLALKGIEYAILQRQYEQGTAAGS
jgi:hypothetical protein